MKRIMTFMVCAIAVCLLASPALAADKKQIKLRIGSGHAAEATHWTYGVSQYFQPTVKDRVAKETNYEIVWTDAYGGTVAKLGEEIEAVESGLLDLACVVLVFEPTKLMLHGMTYRMPFQSGDPVVVAEVAQELYDEFPDFKNTYDRYNQKFLGVLVSDDYGLFSNYPIKNVDDVKGRKIAGAGANLKWLEGTGAIGVQSSLVEGYTSMQTGVYDGFINPTVPQFKYKVHEVGPYLLVAGFGVQMVANLTINKDVWDELPAEVQKIFEEEGRKMTKWQAEYVKKDYNDAIENLRNDKTVTITFLPEEEKARWANLLPNIVGDDLAKELNSKGYPGSAIIKAYYDKLQKRGYIMVREWKLP